MEWPGLTDFVQKTGHDFCGAFYCFMPIGEKGGGSVSYCIIFYMRLLGLYYCIMPFWGFQSMSCFRMSLLRPMGHFLNCNVFIQVFSSYLIFQVVFVLRVLIIFYCPFWDFSPWLVLPFGPLGQVLY